MIEQHSVHRRRFLVFEWSKIYCSRCDTSNPNRHINRSVHDVAKIKSNIRLRVRLFLVFIYIYIRMLNVSGSREEVSGVYVTSGITLSAIWTDLYGGVTWMLKGPLVHALFHRLPLYVWFTKNASGIRKRDGAMMHFLDLVTCNTFVSEFVISGISRFGGSTSSHFILWEDFSTPAPPPSSPTLA